MAARNLTHQHDRFVDPTLRTSQGLNRAVPVYHMRSLDDGDGIYKRWTSDNTPDFTATDVNAPTPVGTLTDIVVERIENRSSLTARKSRHIHSWNGTDISQFTQVMGNGVGGVGTPGDWTLAFSSFPNDDAPSIAMTNNTAVSSPSIWLFNDYGGILPECFAICYRNLLVIGGVCDFGIVIYYEDNDHYMAIRRASLNETMLYVRNGATASTFNTFGRLYTLPSANRDSTYGEIVGCTARVQKASSSVKPWVTVKMGGESYSGWSESSLLEFHRATALDQASADNDWLSLGSYSPRIGIVAFGAGASGTEHAGGVSFLNAYGGV